MINNILIVFFSICFPLLSGAKELAPDNIFRLHLPNEPTHLDPQKQKSSASSYLLGNIFRNFYKFDDNLGLIPDLGETCRKLSPKILECKLKKNLHWSDGSDLTSHDFLKTYQKLLNPKNAAFRADLLFSIKNAKEIYLEKPKKLGITAPDKWTLRYEFADANESTNEFQYNLANLILAPTKEDLQIASGPYKIKNWKKGEKIVLQKNDFYVDADPNRPQVEFLFIEEDSVALQLYEKNELQLLRRLPTLYISEYKDRKDFHWISVTRFDYIGFGSELKDKLSLRKAIAHSLNFLELQRIFSSFGVPGCVGLPSSWFERSTNPCYHYDKLLAEKEFQSLNPSEKMKNYTFLLSSLGGEDHKRMAEWAQDQWQKIGIKISPLLKENKTYLAEMKASAPALFRKGNSLDRPTCLAALEIFDTDNPGNYVAQKSPEFSKILMHLRKAPTETAEKKYCTEGFRFLMDRYLFIPLGGYDFSMLIKENFTGWRFNRMNQLDLSRLHAK